MPLPLHIRNPGLVARVEAAYEKARRERDGLSEDLGTTAIDALVAEDTALAREAGRLPGAQGFETIPDQSTRQSFETALATTTELFARIGLIPPAPDQLVAAGIDLPDLAHKYQAMEQKGHQPEIVLAPRLSQPAWHRLYAALAADPAVNLGEWISYGGLQINSDVSATWDSLTTVPPGVPAVTAPATNTGSPGHDDQAIAWTLQLIPGTPEPTAGNVTHNDPAYEALHPTVQEYLSLQASRLHSHQDPVDTFSVTWLADAFAGKSWAPGGGWSASGGSGLAGLVRCRRPVRSPWRAARGGVGFFMGR